MHRSVCRVNQLLEVGFLLRALFYHQRHFTENDSEIDEEESQDAPNDEDLQVAIWTYFISSKRAHDLV